MKRALKQLASFLLPGRTFTAIQAARSRRRNGRYLEEIGRTDLNRRVIAKLGHTVLRGPFAGLKCNPDALPTHHHGPIILGTIEHQLAPIFEQIGEGSYDMLVDIGCADGYYAVGMAMRSRSPVCAYDACRGERHLCAGTARLNGVGHLVHIRSWCSPTTLQELARGRRIFVLSDIEGGEFALFTPGAIAALSRSDLVIELHGNAVQNQELASRFGKTHSVKVIADSRHSELKGTLPQPILAALGGTPGTPLKFATPA